MTYLRFDCCIILDMLSSMSVQHVMVLHFLTGPATSATEGEYLLKYFKMPEEIADLVYF